MALQITNNAGIFEINGSLNSQNTISLKNYFEAQMNECSFIMISLNNTIGIDKVSFQTIINLYKNALSRNKVFYIVRTKNQQVVDLCNEEKLSFLLSNNVA